MFIPERMQDIFFPTRGRLSIKLRTGLGFFCVATLAILGVWVDVGFGVACLGVLGWCSGWLSDEGRKEGEEGRREGIRGI